MAASDYLQKARANLAAGHFSRSLKAGWWAADAALLEGDVETLRSVIDLAEALSQVSVGRVAQDAQRLDAYCRHCYDGEGAESQGVLARLFRWGPRKRTCPDCAEQILPKARVCRYCGFRLDEQ